MKRLKCKLAYDGTYFAGYQVQPNKRTIQGEIEAILKKMHKGEDIKVVASGRTDAGVHAKGQIIHFDSTLTIPANRWHIALNTMLPNDLAVLEVEEVENSFHARFDAVGKEYRYIVHTDSVRNPFERDYAYHYPFPLDITKMRKASAYLVGTHDFTSFCSAKTEVENRVRTIKKIEILADGHTLSFRFIGTGFLYNMVRILVGTLLQVGSGVIEAEALPVILEKRDRTFAGKTAPPQGLYLWEVHY